MGGGECRRLRDGGRLGVRGQHDHAALGRQPDRQAAADAGGGVREPVFRGQVVALTWGLDNYVTARSRYRLNYAARLRLVDAQGALVATAECRSEQGDIDNPPSREALLAQNAFLVKGYLDLATAHCIEHAR